jgi:hypothetical protein
MSANNNTRNERHLWSIVFSPPEEWVRRDTSCAGKRPALAKCKTACTGVLFLIRLLKVDDDPALRFLGQSPGKTAERNGRAVDP